MGNVTKTDPVCRCMRTLDLEKKLNDFQMPHALFAASKKLETQNLKMNGVFLFVSLNLRLH